MEIIKEFKEIPHLSLALGFFDGLHSGHREVIGSAVNFALKTGNKSAVVTFGNHPYCYLQGVNAPKYILTKSDKYSLLENFKVDYVIELDFEKIRELSAEDYIKEVLVKCFSPVAISTGFSHCLGRNRSGNLNLLTDLQSKYNYKYFAIPEKTINGTKISSTEIRNLIKLGRVEAVEDMLGRKFSISGTVQRGKGKGHCIGFPTANIPYPLEIIQPPRGVYDVNVILPDGASLRGIANYGTCPTITDGSITSFETHILNFDADLYGKDIRIEFNRKIRDEVKFEDVEQLKLQISTDINSLK